MDVRPLRDDAFDDLFAAAADPVVWEQHPETDRWQPDVFRRYFEEQLASGGAVVVVERASGRVIGASRYDNYDSDRSEVEIGWTFLARPYWGGAYNADLKRIMVEHAFRFVQTVVFLVDERNLRSRRAVEKLGAIETGMRRGHVLYELRARPLRLHPLRRDHASEVLAFELANRTYFAAFISDRGDAFFDEFDERYDELLAAREASGDAYYVLVDDDGSVLGRFNLYGIADGTAEVGYRVAERAAGRGVATAGLRELCRLAAAEHGVRRLCARTTHENVASQRVLANAGFVAAGEAAVAGRAGIRFERGRPEA